jgi:hypothetical protein
MVDFNVSFYLNCELIILSASYCFPFIGDSLNITANCSLCCLPVLLSTSNCLPKYPLEAVQYLVGMLQQPAWHADSLQYLDALPAL